MSIGYLTQYITIQNYKDVVDSSGSAQREWQDIRKCWARINMIYDKDYLVNERFFDGIISTRNYYEVKVRAFSSDSLGGRILWDDKTLRIIKHFKPHLRGNFIIMIAIEEFE